MRKLDKEKIVVIMEKDPKEFEKAVNAAMEEKKLDSPTLEMHIFEDVFKAIIHYIVPEEQAATMKEKAHCAGVYFSCSDCPYFEPPEDGRQRWGACPISQYGKVRRDDDACEFFYKQQANGGSCERKVVIKK